MMNCVVCAYNICDNLLDDVYVGEIFLDLISVRPQVAMPFGTYAIARGLFEGHFYECAKFLPVLPETSHCRDIQQM